MKQITILLLAFIYGLSACIKNENEALLVR